MTSPMERTRSELKNRGIINQIVERYFPKSRKYPFGCKEDFLNIIDLIALDSGIVGIQVFGSDVMPHKKKIMHEHKSKTIAWLDNGGRLECHGWRKRKKKRGGKAMVWSARIFDVILMNNELFWEER